MTVGEQAEVCVLALKRAMTDQQRQADVDLSNFITKLTQGLLPPVEEAIHAINCTMFLGYWNTCTLLTAFMWRAYPPTGELGEYVEPHDEFEGMTHEEKKATLDARINTVLGECNPNLPVYEPK